MFVQFEYIPHDNAPNGSTANTNQEDKVSKTNPLRSGYTFSGWFTSDTGGTKVE